MAQRLFLLEHSEKCSTISSCSLSLWTPDFHFQMSISAVKLNENVDQCDTSPSKVTPEEITRVMPLVLPAIF